MNDTAKDALDAAAEPKPKMSKWTKVCHFLGGLVLCDLGIAMGFPTLFASLFANPSASEEAKDGFVVAYTLFNLAMIWIGWQLSKKLFTKIDGTHFAPLVIRAAKIGTGILYLTLDVTAKVLVQQ